MDLESFVVLKSLKMPTKNKNPGLKLFTKTWPLKREKKVKNEHNNSRPLTATLEKPLVLDMRLAGKIDMSLIRKEFLSISNLCRLPLVVKIKNKENIRPSSLLNSEIRIKKKKSDTEDDESSVIQSAKNFRSKSNPRSSKRSVIFPLKKNTPVKIISDANNNNKIAKVPHRKITSEKLKSVSNSVSMPSQTHALKLSTKQVPEPCRSCGRTDQPERFHSHPATPLEMTPVLYRRNCLTASLEPKETTNKIPVKITVQKPVAIKYHSKIGTQEKRKTSSLKKSNESTLKSVPATKLTSPTNNNSALNISTSRVTTYNNNNNNNSTPSSNISQRTSVVVHSGSHLIKNSKDYPQNPKSSETEMNSKRDATARVTSGKRTLTCYICGREFGTASLPLHEPKCLEKWERENAKLPRNLRRKSPVKPEGQISQQEWNLKAWESSQATLIPCANCGRTFLPDRLVVHQRSCKATSPTKRFSSSDTPSTSSSVMSDHDSPSSLASSKEPPTVQCYICRRKFGTHSIEIHERNCLKKWHLENESLPADMRTAPPLKNGKRPSVASTNAAQQKEQKPAKEERRPASGVKAQILPCYLCGKLFSVHSIYVHEPQCLKMWHIENDKLPPNKRRQPPMKPDIKFTGSGKLNIEATTDAFWQSHLEQLVPCKMCSRTFNPDRVAVHEKSCKGA